MRQGPMKSDPLSHGGEVNYVALGGFSRLYRQAVEETGVHSSLSAPTVDTVTTLR